MAVDDPAVQRARADEFQRLLIRARFRNDTIGQVRTIEARDVAAWFVQLEMLDDVLAHAIRGRGGERHERNLRKQLAQLGNLPVLGTKIVAPLTDAMRLVHCDERHVPPLQVAEETGEH